MSEYSEITELKVLLGTYLPPETTANLDEAWKFACRVHKGQCHFSGKPYIEHVSAVAQMLASMQLDYDTVLGGLLHGVMRHSGISFKELELKFGEDVASIVDGMSRVTRVVYNAQLVSKADSIRKMLLAVASDIRVLLIRLVDRLQDMFSLETVDREIQVGISRETMDIYAPLASRLGIEWLKRELEDTAFSYLYPEEYASLEAQMEVSLEDRQRYVDQVLALLKKSLSDGGVYPLRIYGRPKQLYSIYKKLVAQNITLEKVYDKVAFRIIVNTIPECYGALGIIHSMWSPIQERIKDFISVPKSNNYQSIHTTVLGPRGHFIEIQIRTDEMDKVAQEGVAAHWAYKEGSCANVRDAKLFHELKKLIASLQEVEDPREFMDSLMAELYDPEVFALTPGGDVRELPAGSCPIDFAYSIHSEIGDHCIGAKIGNRHVPLKYQLKNGDVVEIITSATQQPKRDWLDLVKTGRARARIRSWLRREEREKALQLGREICDQAIRRHQTSLKRIIKSGNIRLLLKALRCNSLDDLLIKVGSGVISVENIARALQPAEVPAAGDVPMEISLERIGEIATGGKSNNSKNSSGIDIDGVEGMLVKLSKCCSPIPGDDIVGFVTIGHGVSIHKATCPNLKHADPNRLIAVSWAGIAEKTFQTTIFLQADNKRGLFAEVAGVITSEGSNIVDVTAHSSPEEQAQMTIVIEVEGVEQMRTLLQHLRQLPGVVTARRM
jgi:GTP pyrophosphokinase